MEFREGMLGVVVVALALTGALFASYFAGIESEETQYTDYDYLADVSGLFEYDQSPTYIEFDPSTNYTGYYSTDTGEYWPDGLVDFVKNINPTTKQTRANNYRINYEPTTIVDDETADLTDLTEPEYVSGKYAIRYVYSDSGTRSIPWNYPSYPMTLANLLKAMGLSSDSTDLIYITVGDSVNWDQTPTGSYNTYLSLDAVLFAPSSWFQTYGAWDTAWITNPNFDLEKVQSNYNTVTIHHPIQSLVVNYSRGLVDLYYDTAWSSDYVYSKQVDISSILVCFGDDKGQDSADLDLADSFTYSAYQSREKTYLDPNYGVSLTQYLSIVTVAMDGGSVSGTGTYYEGDSVTIEATPDSGYVFSHWSDGSTSATRTITVTSSIVGQRLTYIAYFESE